jgi:hypothetical protein
MQALAAGTADAVRKNDDELINQEFFGNTAGGRSTSGTAGRSAVAGAGGLIAGAFATGRLRGSEHDGIHIRVLENTGGVLLDDGVRRTFAFDVKEKSALANVVITAPGQVAGGTVKISGFAGYNWLSLELKPNAENPAIPGTIGSAYNESVIFGGSWLWAGQGTYVVATGVGTLGNTQLIDTWSTPAIYHFDTVGFIGTLTAGRTIPLPMVASPAGPGSPSGPMLDLRTALGYVYGKADTFLNVHGNEFRSWLSAWNATASATLFTNIVQNDAVFRPFVQAYVRQEFAYDQRLKFSDTPGGEPHLIAAYRQEGTYGGADAGFTYTRRNMTFGASVYVEQSGDERTLGGRVRASWQLN